MVTTVTLERTVTIGPYGFVNLTTGRAECEKFRDSRVTTVTNGITGTVDPTLGL